MTQRKSFKTSKPIFFCHPLPPSNLSNPPAIELPYVHHIVLVLQHSSFVIIYIKIIGCGEYCDERWKASRLAFSVHTVSGVLRLVGADDREQIVVLQKLAAGCIAVNEKVFFEGHTTLVTLALKNGQKPVCRI